ncbi:DPP IV N-terminal domain-containing protein, partial [Ideonella sp.]|uniref:S9 family peptidase n=1 Tax=Ideonella sp. TaxID=1929293 RepID=UPI003BB5D38A
YRMDLWVFERATGQARRLIDSRAFGVEAPVSAAEQARRERERTARLSGVLRYSWSPDGRSVLFPLGEGLYLATLGPNAADGSPAAPQVRQIAKGADLIDPRLSPRGRYVSYLRDQNLHVLDLQTGRSRALTRDGGGTVHNAESEFVAQEEMDQPEGYWWAPDDSAIAYKRFDEAPVGVQQRVEFQADRAELVAQRYPLTGTPNVTVKLGLVSPQGGATRWIDLGAERDIYLPRVDWLPDGRALSYQRQSRDQRTLELMHVDTRSLKQRLLQRETSKTWVELHKDLHFLRGQDAFVWATERSGRKHLLLIGLDGQTRRVLSQGDWQLDEVLAVDEAAGTVWVAGDASAGDLSRERQVLRLKLDGSSASAPERISQGGGWHEASFADNGQPVQLYVDTHSDRDRPPQTRILNAQGEHLAWIEENKLDASHPYAPYLAMHQPSEFGTLAAVDGQRLNYEMIKPPGFDPKKRYPVYLEVYGGPGVQLVTRSWGDLFAQVMAQRGYIVFTLDNRGSSRRGRAFSDVIKGRLGEAEWQDQMTGVRWLKAQPWVDGARIGVSGWSYGGFMALTMLARSSDELAGAVSGAPVTRFELYDTHYTERYLDTPQTNPAGYKATSVFSHLAGLKAPLLLIHGMADDNVLFSNSTELMAALQTQGTPFRLMTYPGQKHGLSDKAMNQHKDQMIADWFDEVIKGRP